MTKPNTNEVITSDKKTAFYVPFHQLVNSDKNVRKFKTSEPADKALANSIKVVGLLQSLVVSKTSDGKYEIHAGKRRFGAMGQLVKDKVLTKDYKVLVNVIDAKDAHLASLSENHFREEMHKLDQFKAIRDLKDENMTIDNIALSLSIPKTQVQKWLKLMTVCDEVLEHYGNDEISLDCLQMFTLNSNHKEQIKAYNQYAPNVQSWQIRNHFTNETMEINHRLVQLVGMEEYRSKGGKDISDLFNEKHYLTNPEIIEDLARSKLEAFAKTLDKEGWGWVEIDTENIYFHSYDNTPSTPIPLTKKQKTDMEKQDALCKRIDVEWDLAIDEAKSKGEELSSELTSEFEERYDEAIEKLERMKDETENNVTYDDIAKPYSGAIVYVDDGNICVKRGLMTRKDSSKYQQLLSNNNTITEGITVNNAEADSELTQTLKDLLKQEDQQLFQCALLQNPLTAFDALSFELCYSVLSEAKRYSWSQCFDGSLKDNINTNPEMINTIAYKEIEKNFSSINRKWVKGNLTESYIEFCKLSQNEKVVLMGLCSAHAGIAESQSFHSEEKSIYREILKQTKFIKSDYWSPTTDKYFKRLSLPMLHKLAIEVIGEKWCKQNESLLKKDFVAKISSIFKTGKGLNAEVKKSIANYLPRIML